MEISSSNLDFRIAMIKLDELKPHEEVLEPVVGSLANEVLTEKKIRDPLIVDQHDHVILDGMHRFNSLKLLKCRFVPCCLVDYDSPYIKVGSWFRLFNVNAVEQLSDELLTEAKLNYSKVHIDPAHVNYNPQTIILTKNGYIFLLPEPMDPIQRARTAVALEKTLAKKGHAPTYLSEIVALQELKKPGQGNLVISTPIFTKNDIRQFGLTGRLLPHKVTRHVIPSRPLGIDVPLELLMDSVSREEADRRLGELLAKRHVDRKPPGSVVDGRRYEEELLIFAP